MSKDFYHPQPQRRATQRKRKGPRAWYEISLPGSQPLRNPSKFNSRRRRDRSTAEITEGAFASIDMQMHSYDGMPYVTEDGREIDQRERITRRRPLDTPAPCFFFSNCRTYSEVEKQGKAVCKACAARLPGQTFPLRTPQATSTYASSAELMRALE